VTETVTDKEREMSSFGARILTGSVLAVIGLITVKAIVSVASGLMALISFMIFTVLPIVLIGWLLLRLVKYLGKGDSPAVE
jgi:hypothetical protein